VATGGAATGLRWPSLATLAAGGWSSIRLSRSTAVYGVLQDWSRSEEEGRRYTYRARDEVGTASPRTLLVIIRVN
jgi:hypothetical protein